MTFLSLLRRHHFKQKDRAQLKTFRQGNNVYEIVNTGLFAWTHLALYCLFYSDNLRITREFTLYMLVGLVTISSNRPVGFDINVASRKEVKHVCHSCWFILIALSRCYDSLLFWCYVFLTLLTIALIKRGDTLHAAAKILTDL